MMIHQRVDFRRFLVKVALIGAVLMPPLAYSSDDPAVFIENTVNNLLAAYTERRDELEADKQALFETVDELVGPAFSFEYIAKLVLAKNWKKASVEQRQDFVEEFRRLMIVTYATGLNEYVGTETMIFREVKTKERNGTLLATVKTDVTMDDNAPPLPVVYSLIRKEGENWKVYNLTVGTLNMVLNYRKVIQSLIHSEGLQGVIENLKINNNRNYP